MVGEFDYVMVTGAKGGETPRQPVETPDSLISIAYARTLDAISEGPIEGVEIIALDYTRLQNPDGSFNFQNVTTDIRYGTQDQTYVSGFPGVESESAVNVELTSDAPIIRTYNNASVNAVRFLMSLPAWSKQDTSNGDLLGYSASFAVDVSVDGGAWSTVAVSAFTGKTTTRYQRSIRIELPAGSMRQVRYRRLTPNQNLSTIQDRIMIESNTELIDVKMKYPNTAYVGLKFDASQFSGIPVRGYFGKWRKIKVPANYDPIGRTYSGIWNGTFKIAWSNNPAWVYYDMLVNDRFGLGNRISEDQVNRYYLYQIAQYCDQMVSDGMGGIEPRFTCDIQLQVRTDAYIMMSNLASVFRGISYYAVGQMIASADMPREIESSPIFTAANVVDGVFEYSDTAASARHTVAMVSWNDQTDYGRAKVEPVVYQAGVARYGIRQTDVTGFGCSSRSQAQRIGNYILFTENLETDLVNFAVGLDGAVLLPGMIFRVADAARAGRRMGGRIRTMAGRIVTLDQAPDVFAIGDKLYLTMSDGTTQVRTISAISNNQVTVGMEFDGVAERNAIWGIVSSQLAMQPFRVLSVTPEENNRFRIAGVQYIEDKYASIDDGTRIELPPITVVPPSVQPPPTNVRLSSHVVIDQGIAKPTLVIEWDPAASAVAYDVEWQRDDMGWVKGGRVSTTSTTIEGVYAGVYVARIHALGPMNNLSIPALSARTNILGKTEPPPTLASLTTESLVMGIRVLWSFLPGSSDTERTEIFYWETDDLSLAIKLGDYAYPQDNLTMMGLGAGQRFYFWGRLVDKSGNIGPFYPLANGVMGESSADAEQILEYLDGKIGETQLSDELFGIIEPIIPDMAGDASFFAGDGTRYAGGWTLQYAQQEGDYAMAKRVDTVVARVDENNALIQTETTARVEGDTALATQVTTVQAVAAGSYAIAQQSLEATVGLNGQIGAFYNIKLQVNNNGELVAAGMGIGVENTPSGMQTQVIFQADRMALYSIANGQKYIPWAIENGQVFITSAFIKDASITNAKIGDVIQASALGAGNNPRWKLDKTAGLTMYGAVGSSGYMVLNDQALRFWNTAGTFAICEFGELTP